MIFDDFFVKFNLQEKNIIIENFGEFFASRTVLTSTGRDDGTFRKKQHIKKAHCKNNSTPKKITAPR
jgi:hypothetical protein